ncbi:MAG: PilT/PilU family type 4a pilus ATPase [Lentisphaeria bacterium]|nr:PilT/PilU family type 4a pilus ATPase [Lentisphaeria bacterium]
MQTDVQWFVSALIDNELVTLQDATALDNELGGDSDLGTFAQTFLERYIEASGMSEEDSAQLVESIQQLIDYAVAQAETGEMPGFALEAEPKKISSGKLPGPKRRPKPAASAAPAEAPAQQAAAPAPAPEAPAEGSAASEIIVASEGFEFFDHLQEMDDGQLAATMKNLLFQLVDYGASDLHISANSTPFVRRNLKIERLSNTVITAEYAEKLNTVLLSPEQKARFKEDMDMNFALELNGSRYRVALMVQKDGISGSYRIVPAKAKTLEELGFLPKDAETITKLMDYPNGLVLVTGPIGSGKTTTLAALINICNNSREDHIIAVEDPIEIVQPPLKCQITQRQLHDNTESYSNALRGALRQDPDIIVIGEMFDLETIENAITASETGHLVIGTLHTCDAANTMNRLLDVFPPSQQTQIRAMTAGSLRGIICQRLINGSDGNITIAYEILINTLAVGSIITEGQNFKLKGEMQTGQKAGMTTMDATIFEKYKAGMVDYEVALANITDATTLQDLKREMAIREAKKLAAAAQARQAAEKQK